MPSSRSWLPVTPIDLLTLYAEIWLHDFEYVALPGEHPDVVCLVAHELRSGRTLRLWHDELGEQPPYRTDSGNYIYDCPFHAITDASALAAALAPIPGVVENGLFVALASALVIGGRAGVRVIER